MTKSANRRPINLSVVIPTLNEERYLARTLDSLCGYSSPEVIVVDASLNDYTKKVASEYATLYDLKYARSPKQDIGYQRNLGAKLAKNERLLFLDADTLVGKGALEACSYLNGGPLFVASIRHIPDRDSLSTRVGMLVINALILLCRAVGLPVTNGDFILTNKQTHQAIGGFKEGYLLGEDTDFGLRARQAGAKTLIMWKHHVVASSRRLSTMSVPSLVWTWSRAYIRAIFVGPTPRNGDVTYPFGNWGSEGR
ncbi:glycosyltransferase family 2 protein [Micromonospora chalcea]